MPLIFLDHRLVVGDSLIGPFWDKLLFRPGKPDPPVEDLFSQGIHGKLQKALTEALSLVRRLESSVGSDLADVLDKEAIKVRLDQALLPFRVAVAAWAGGVMLGPEKCDDVAHSQYLKVIGQTGRLPDVIESDVLRSQIARGLGLEPVPNDRPGLEAAVSSIRSIPALGYDLTFPEVFHPRGVPHGKQGFHAVLGNPPWDTTRKSEDHFFGMHDFSYLDSSSPREKFKTKEHLLSDSAVHTAFEKHIGDLECRDRINDVLFETHKVKVKGELAWRGTYDDYMLFAEHATRLVNSDGSIGLVLPSAFHANEGATGTRHLYLKKVGIQCCYSFENRNRLFEIEPRFKFATIVARAGRASDIVSCAFYVHDDKWLFAERNGREPLQYTMEFICRTGGDYYPGG
jgi:hypothetical protein